MNLRNRLILVLGALLAFGGSSCRLPEKDGPEQGAGVSGKTIERVLNDYTDQWMAIPGVVGTAIGQCKGKPCILILTESNTEQVRRRIPATAEGYPVVIQYTGEIRALEEP